jgi:hypothetical protein
MRAAFPILLAMISAGALSCSSGGGGDLDLVTPHPVVLGTPIANANNPATVLRSGSKLEARGVVVIAVDQYDETKDGKSIGNIYVQDPVQPTDWSGLTLFNAAKNPPDLILPPGSGVDVVGPYQPFAGPASGLFPPGIVLPEVVKGAVNLVYEGSPPQPVDITLDAFKVPTDAMKYVGRLVRMKDVTLVGDWDKRHQAPISADKTVMLAAQFYAVDDPATNIKNGTKLASVTGVLNYFYTFDLCPRTPDDIKP